MVLESLPGFYSNLHVFPLLTGFFHPYCPEDHHVSYVDHLPSWYWGVSGFCKLHSFLKFQNFPPLGLGSTIIFHFLLTLLYVHGRDGPMIIIEVLDEYCKCAIGIIYVVLAFPLDVLILQ